MDVERLRMYVLSLPHVVETMQWGENLVFFVGDKAIGGKMFGLVPLDAGDGLVMSFAAGAERAQELYEREGLCPAPYLARAHWVAAERWDVFSTREWQAELSRAHAIVLAKLPRRVLRVLALPKEQQAALVADRRKVLAAEAAAGKSKRHATVSLRSRTKR